MTKHAQKYQTKKQSLEESDENDNDSNFESSDNNNDNQREDRLSKILDRLTALENENKTLKAKLKNKTSALSSRNEETPKISQSSSSKYIQKMDRMAPKLTSKKYVSSLEQSSSEQESDSNTEIEEDILHKDCKTKEDVSCEDCKTKDTSYEGYKAKEDLPIPKPTNFTNLHLKLNLEKNIYQSYKVNLVNYNINYQTY